MQYEITSQICELEFESTDEITHKTIRDDYEQNTGLANGKGEHRGDETSCVMSLSSLMWFSVSSYDCCLISASSRGKT